MIIGLQGYAGSGKSTVAKYLVERHGFARRHIKHTLARMADVLLEDSHPHMTPEGRAMYLDGGYKREGITALGGRSATEIQQFLGTEFGREFIHPDLWLDIWHRWALEQPGHVVQESVRFANEAERCDVVWEIRREGYGAHNGHVSEGLPSECGRWPNMVVSNDGTTEELYTKVDMLLELAEKYVGA